MCWPSKSFLSLAKHSVNSRVEILEWFQIFSRFDTLRALALFGFRLLNKCIYFVCDFHPHPLSSRPPFIFLYFFPIIILEQNVQKRIYEWFFLFHRHDETLTSLICYYVLPNLIDIFVCFFLFQIAMQHIKSIFKKGFGALKNGFYSWYFGKILCF